jgi:putative redox protein
MVEAIARRRDGYTHDVEIDGHHTLVFDEPREAGGADRGPSPTRTLAASLAACTAITAEMYADRKGWDVGALEVRVEMEYGQSGVPSTFAVALRLPRSLSAEQAERLLVIAGKCPVHRALTGHKVTVTDRVELV